MMRSRSLLTATGYLGVLVAAWLLVIWVTGPTIRAVLLGWIVTLAFVPMGLRLIQGHLDIFEPIVTANIALAVMFLARPIDILLTRSTLHLGYDTLSTFDEALLVALVGIGALQLGYFSRFGAAWASRLPRPGQFRPQQAALAGWGYVGLGGLLFGGFLARSGGMALLFGFLEGRQYWQNNVYLGATGYLYNGLLLWAAAALIFLALSTVTRHRAYLLASLLPLCGLFLYSGSLGNRIDLLPVTLAIPAFWYLHKHKRPSLGVLLAALIIGVPLLGWMRQVRTASIDRDLTGTLARAFSSPVEEAIGIMGGADTEMFDSLAAEINVVPAQLPFQHGATVTDTLIRAVPRPLWPAKPLESSDAVGHALWPEHYEHSRAGPAFSVIGFLYADSGYFTVGLGMFVVGVLLSTVWGWLRLHHAQPVAQMVYGMVLPLVVVLMRGTIPDTLSRILFLVVPLILLMPLTQSKTRTAHLRCLPVVRGKVTIAAR